MRQYFLLGLLLTSLLASSQRNVYTNHNRLLQNKAENGGYYLIGPFKVQGNPYYVKEVVKGDMFSPGEKAMNVQLRYDVYNQNVEFLTTANPDEPLVKEPGDLDSFILRKDEKNGVKQDIKFVSGDHIGAGDKFYYAELVRGTKYSLYRKTYAELIIPVAKISVPEMREFENNEEFYYVNENTGEVKKINPNSNAVKKEFQDVKNLSEVLQKGSMFKKPDEALVRTFNYLNE